MQIITNMIYRDDTDYNPQLNSLDIYFDPSSVRTGLKKVVVFIHGGGWSEGDKAFNTNDNNNPILLPSWFVDQGYVFVSINFRLAESYKTLNATIPDSLLDISKALKWLTANIRRYGGQVKYFILLGYSSGAYLATLIATDQSHLKKYRMNTSVLHAVISIDIAHFDIPLVIDKLRNYDKKLGYRKNRAAKLIKLIGKLPSIQKHFSPSYHVSKDTKLHDIKFLLLSAGFTYGQEHSLTFEMNKKFKDLLLSYKINVIHRHFPNRDHSDFINKFDNEIQETFLEFLSGV